MTDQDKPGYDWEARARNAGSNAQPANMHPYCTSLPHNVQPVRESDMTTDPNVNVIG